MKLLLLSVKLFVFGYFCDVCAGICTRITEKRLKKNRPLNGRLLAYVSNLSNNSLAKWQITERRFIHLSLNRRTS